MSIDATELENESQEAEGTEGSPEAEGTTESELVASYRKRQAGAEAARQTAERKARELEAKLAEYEAAHQTAEQADLSELARTQARLEAAERRAAEAEAKAEARILDARFPNARKELPEVTDEVRLARFEAMLAEDSGPDLPTPRRTSVTKAEGQPGKPAESTPEEDWAALKLQGVPEDYLNF